MPRGVFLTLWEHTPKNLRELRVVSCQYYKLERDAKLALYFNVRV